MSKKNRTENKNKPADNFDTKQGDGCRGGKAQHEQKERENRGNRRSRNWWEQVEE